MKITTLPVYSKLANEDDVPNEVRAKLPDGLRLSQHQVETCKALTSGEYDVVFNTAMTGDGKSLAAYLRTLVLERSALAMYPTNELARDQELQLANWRAQWHCEQVRVTRMSADILQSMVDEGVYERKGTAIAHLAANNDVVLTNPDIFHYLAQFFYTLGGDAPDKLFSRKIMDLFDLFVFDEFHVFQIPQVVSVLNALLLVREVAGSVHPKRFLFLSATPVPFLEEYLGKAGFRIKAIQPEAEGGYLHSLTPPDAAQWRPIVQSTDICFWPLDANRRAEDWCEEHCEDTLLAFFRQQRPGAKGAFIVNSVATAHRLHARLQPALAAEGLHISLNTGFTAEELRRTSLDADLVIATSTVDIGVDFSINLLVFESRDAGTFLQRLGRLGRHTDDGRGHAFGAFEAHALVPHFVQERLFVGKGGEPPLLGDAAIITRANLGQAMSAAYPTPTSFRSYAREWGWVQSAHVYYRLCDRTIRDPYATTREHLKQYYWDVFGISTCRRVHDYVELQHEARQIAEEAQSFRGGSPFQCGVIDMTMQGPEGVKEYNLLTLAANAHMQWMEPEEFRDEAERRGVHLSASKVEGMAGWFRYYGFSPTQQALTIRLSESVSAWAADELGEVQVINGVELDVAGVDWVNALNAHLRRRKFVATLCLIPPNELRYRLRLPPMFGLWEFLDLDEAKGSIAFARDALLLAVALKEQHVACGGGAVIV